MSVMFMAQLDWYDVQQEVKMGRYSREQYEEFRKVWPMALPDLPAEGEDKQWNTVPDLRVTAEELDAIMQDAPKGTVKVAGGYGQGMMLTKLKDDHGKRTGELVQITVPDMGLILMDEVTWKENACTEDLQDMLDQGWRLLAVCPPNAKRRPDYILGRRKQR